MSTLPQDDQWTETQAAAGWPEVEPLEVKLRADDDYERTQAYWASPEGVARQVAEFREHWVPSRPGDDS